MVEELNKVLKDHGVGVGVKGSKEQRLTNQFAADLFTAQDGEKPSILTKHGAHVVLRSVQGGRISYKQLGAALYMESDRLITEEKTKVDALTEVLVKQAHGLPDSAGTELQRAEETAGN